ncbi:hypothetical protein [Bacillus toyonensis]|uniref:hypothetical protein n=1 Tax=Bacillus toyonensis TaxID=155322 RepID=UPI000BEF5BA0|nr:hypothetical protein [Bacillus toyonensis]PEK39655.1 hypothetical protein CN586_28365 [Bacillus toyonensis]PEL53196.1 hypothetical protein CN638_06595 [Bacillus toyonensis]PEM34905.1 hypothetical protein CN636_33025 [Bacillus toyonensis]PGB60583.1 hypothetical protein COM00_15795 [Bacillus toyonensis]PHE79527.1 hypothetical protein COF80_32375 [Bacillus toyonensis]
MKNGINILFTCFYIVIMVLLAFEWYEKQQLSITSLFVATIILQSLFMKRILKGKKESENFIDEMFLHIRQKSLSICCFVMYVLTLGTLFLSEGTWNFNHMHNKPLIFLVFLYPIVYQISHIFVSRNNS